MFTGIVQATGLVKSIILNGSNLVFWIESPISAELKVDQSVSHNGVCLTVEEIRDSSHRVTAIAETLDRSNLADWKEGTLVNLEQCLRLNDRLDGHLVQGHVDTVATCTQIKEKNGSREYRFTYPARYAPLLIEKGSICLNGISLTIFDVKRKRFTVAVIPYTLEHTNMRDIVPGDKVNIEFDVIGKYLLRSLILKG